MAVKLALSIIVLAIGTMLMWLFGSTALMTEPRLTCDWSRDGIDKLCSDYGNFYWMLFSVSLIATTGILYLINKKRNKL